MSATLIIGIVALTVTISVIVSSAVLVSKIASASLESLANAQKLMSDAVMEITSQYDSRLSSVLDRFQAIRWEDLAAMRSVDEGEDGGFFAPTEPEADDDDESGLEEPGRFGPLSRLRESSRLTNEEQELLDEDFPDETGVA